MIERSRNMERKSSAVTLSDMELFVFPELLYSLVLANIMSPRIWKWREDPWFDGMEDKKPYRRITRLKQYIMHNYVFNLDLDTWGLTTKERELERFEDFIDRDILNRSNALFGYEGDKYYFDIDIRTHFGLDKYEGNIIPYWKTESVEAMDAFRHKPGYKTGAGECVSLSSLYCAALFIVAGIPLSDIYMMATPLHSQNFVDVDDGILTNNRRLVTKNMWYNGTALSAQARRALENEQVTIVGHESGYIHTMYREATIKPEAWEIFKERLRCFLEVNLSDEILGNYLRHRREIQKCFQFRWEIHGVDHYVAAERVFAYEHGSPFLVTDNTREKLMNEIDGEEFHCRPIADRLVINDIEQFVRDNNIDLNDGEAVEKLKTQFPSGCLHRDDVIEGLTGFCRTTPRLPNAGEKEFARDSEPLGIEQGMTREEIIERLESIRASNATADMAFYAYRDLTRTEAAPFLLAAVERNPVSAQATASMTEEEVFALLKGMPDHSIYDEPGRLAQPDEVWNYGQGDGAEKAILLAAVLRSRLSKEEITIILSGGNAAVKAGSRKYVFPSAKTITEQELIIPG